MRASQDCYTIIKKWEGLEDGDPTTVNLDPYLCPADVATIGWGHAIRGKNGRLLRGRAGLEEARLMYPNGITMEEAEDLLKEDVFSTEVAVDDWIRVGVSQGQFDALVSFAFNVGIGNFRTSTLLKLLNAGKSNKAAEEFSRWKYSRGRVLAGLVSRRSEERDLFLS